MSSQDMPIECGEYGQDILVIHTTLGVDRCCNVHFVVFILFWIDFPKLYVQMYPQWPNMPTAQNTSSMSSFLIDVGEWTRWLLLCWPLTPPHQRAMRSLSSAISYMQFWHQIGDIGATSYDRLVMIEKIVQPVFLACLDVIMKGRRA